MSEFKIKGVGLDTTKLEYTPSEEFEFDYIFTSIVANNESLIKDFSKDASLVTYINFLDKSDEAILSHLELLDRTNIDLLLVDSNCDFKRYIDTINTSLMNGAISEVGIYNPTSIDTIKDILEVMPDLHFIALDVSPLNFNYELISWASENGMEIIGFNSFGGHISSAGLIDSFTVPYLLGFAATYCSLVFLSGRDVFTAADDKGYLMSLVGKESEGIYKLEKSVFRLYKPLKKVVETLIKLDVNHTIPLNNPEAIFSPSELEIKLGEAKGEFRDFDIEIGSVSDLVYKFYQDFKTPEDIESDEAIISLIKPRIMEIMRYKFPGWTVTCNKLADKLFIINVTKAIIKGKWIFKRLKGSESKNYVMSVNNLSLEFYELPPEIPQSALENE